jgi:hypothetical protein
MCNHLVIGFLNRLSTSILHAFQLMLISNEKRGWSNMVSVDPFFINCLVSKFLTPGLNDHRHYMSINVLRILCVFDAIRTGWESNFYETTKKHFHFVITIQYMYNSLLGFLNTVPLNLSGIIECVFLLISAYSENTQKVHI